MLQQCQEAFFSPEWACRCFCQDYAILFLLDWMIILPERFSSFFFSGLKDFKVPYKKAMPASPLPPITPSAVPPSPSPAGQHPAAGEGSAVMVPRPGNCFSSVLTLPGVGRWLTFQLFQEWNFD